MVLSGSGKEVRDKPKGFRYFVDPAQIEEYRKWPISRRLDSLLEGNKLRRSLPAKTIAIQESFR
jgi:hypothetical protein